MGTRSIIPESNVTFSYVPFNKVVQRTEVGLVWTNQPFSLINIDLNVVCECMYAMQKSQNVEVNTKTKESPLALLKLITV